MKLSATFTVKRHDSFGDLGLVMKGRHWADPLGGMAAAHDVLEHFPSDDGSIEHELMALAAGLYVRDMGNYRAYKGQVYRDPGADIGADLWNQVTDYGGDEYTLKDLGRTLPLDDEVEYQLDAAIRFARSEGAHYDGQLDTSYLRAGEDERIKGWLRKGYRRACERYRGIAPSMVMSSFVEGERLLDKFLKHAEEGMECRITFRPDRGDAELKDLGYTED